MLNFISINRKSVYWFYLFSIQSNNFGTKLSIKDGKDSNFQMTMTPMKLVSLMIDRGQISLKLELLNIVTKGDLPGGTGLIVNVLWNIFWLVLAEF